MRIALCTALLILLVAGGIVSAGVPDPVYQEWVTLTPIPSPAATQYAVGEIGPIVGTAFIDIAETTVQGYQMVNTQTSAFTLFWSLVLVVIVIAGIWLIIQKVQEL